MKKPALRVVLWLFVIIFIASCTPPLDEDRSIPLDNVPIIITELPVLPTGQADVVISPTITETPAVIAIPPEMTSTQVVLQEATSTQEKGSVEDESLFVEQRLRALGYVETGIVDGVLDGQTALAISHLQWLNGLPVTGEFTPELLNIVRAGDLISPSAQPPYPARALSQSLPGGFEVGFLKGRLVDLGYLDGADPGFSPYAFDAATEAAVRQFQKLNGLTPNGLANLITWQAVFNPAAVLPDGSSLLEPVNSSDWMTDFYPILKDPIDIAFDGQNIWVLHSSGEDAFDNLLIRIDPKKGLLDQTPPVMLGDLESGNNRMVEIVFDGNRMWVLIPRATDPPQVISFIPKTAEKFIQTAFVLDDQGGFPANALGFDGNKLWATDSERAWAINRNTGQGYLSYYAGWLTQGEMAFDGKCMWMAGESGLTAFHTGGDYACSGGSEAYRMPSGSVVFDGRRIWSAGWNAVYWLDTQTGLVGDPVMVGNSPSALAFDGQRLWVANEGDDSVQGIDVATGSVGLAIPTGRQPVALLYAGQQVWVANAGDRTLQRIDVRDYRIDIVQPTATLIPSLTPTSAATLTPTLAPLTRNLYLSTPWMTGDDVLLLQEQLLRLGYSEIGEADSYFGPKTDQAVRHFQSVNNLIVDGIVGSITWEVLFSSSAKGP